MSLSHIILGITLGLLQVNYCLAEKKEETYQSFINRVLDNSLPIKVKKLELEAEGYKAKQVDYFYLPKVSATGKVKDSNDGINSNITATSLIFDSGLKHRFTEKELKLKVSELSLSKEKEVIYSSIINNLIGIYFLKDLKVKTSSINKRAQNIFNLINHRYNSGVAKESDLEQAKLLMQRIDIEQKNIENEIEQYKSNIELTSGLDFPQEGVSLSDTYIKRLKNTIINSNDIINNTEYSILKMQSEMLKENALQQNSLLNVNMIAEERYINRDRGKNDSYIGLDVKVNVFDLDKKLNELSQLKTFESTKSKLDYKHKEINSKIKNLKLTSSSNYVELMDLKKQRETMLSMIKSQEREYQISHSSFYEMVNTLFDILTIERKIAEVTISDMKNKMEYIQLTGKLSEIENSPL